MLRRLPLLIVSLFLLVSTSALAQYVPIPNELSGPGCLTTPPTDPTQCYGYKTRADMNNRYGGIVPIAPSYVPTVVTSNTTATVGISIYIINGSSTVTMGLPASTGSGATFTFKDVTTNSVIIVPNGSDLIDGANNYVIPANNKNQSVTVTDAYVGNWVTINTNGTSITWAGDLTGSSNSSQTVVSTHLTAPLPVAQGGTQCGSPTTYSGLPSSPTKGQVCSITDSTSCTAGTPITSGGGSDYCQLTYNGASWYPAGAATSAASGGFSIAGNGLTGAGSTVSLTAPVTVANGGTGTASPSLIAGSNVTITGTWPNQTINSTASGNGTINSGTGPALAQYVAGTGTTVGPATLSGDCTIAQGGAITCTKTNGTPFTGAAIMSLPVTVANGGTQCGSPTPYSGLPSSPTTGEICNVTDASGCVAGTPVTSGGSSTACQVTYNGSGWYPAGGATSAASGGFSIAGTGLTGSGATVSLTIPVSVANGGTDATSAGATAANNIGALAIASNLSDLNNAATARTNLGLGTAATQNTGTSGATLGLLNGNLTFGGNVTFSNAPTMSGANISTGTIGLASLSNGTSGNLLIGQGSSPTAYEVMSGDCTITSTGVITCVKSNGTAFGTAAFVNTGTSGATLGLLSGNLTFGGTDTFSIAPILSGASITANTIPIASLANGTAGYLLIAQGSSTATSYNALSGDCTINSSGVITCTKTNGTLFTGAATMSLPVSVANGGTGTASPALTAGTGLSVSGSFPAQQFSLSTPVTVANGGTGSTTAPSSAQLLLGNSGGTAYAPQTMGGDCTIANNGTITCIKTNGTAFTGAATMALPVSAGNGGTGSSSVPSSGQIAIGNSGGTAYAPQTMSQDCTITNAGVITCTKTNNVAFAASATTNALNASNINSGTLGNSYLPSAISVTTLAASTSITDGGLTNGNCVQAGASGILTTVSGPCSTGGSGTVNGTGTTGNGVEYTAATGVSPLTGANWSGTSGSTITLGVAGTSTGIVNLQGSTSATGAVSLTVPNTVTSYTMTLPGAAGAQGSLWYNSNGTGTVAFLPDVASGSVLCSQTSTTAPSYCSNPAISGANFTSGTIPDAALVTAPVTSVTGTSPVASSGGTTPAISITGLVGGVLAGSGPAFTATPTLGVNGTSGTTGTLALANGTTGGASWTLSGGVTTAWTLTPKATAPAQGDLFTWSNATGQMASVADVATGEVLASGGVNTVPAYTSTPSISGANFTSASIPLAAMASQTVTSGGTSGNAAEYSASQAVTFLGDANYSGTSGSTLTLGKASTTAGNLILEAGTSGALTIAPTATTTPWTVTFAGAAPTANGALDLWTSAGAQSFLQDVASGSVLCSQGTTSNPSYCTNPAISGANFVAGSIPDTALATAPVTSISVTAPVASTGGATPTISITGAAGEVLAGASPAFTATPTLGVATSANGTITLENGSAGGAGFTVASGATTSWTLTSKATVPAQGDLFTFSNGTGQMASVADVATGSVLCSEGTTTVPSYCSSPAISGANITAASIPSSALANSGVSAGSYTPANITVNAEGQVTVASSNTFVESRAASEAMFVSGGL